MNDIKIINFRSLTAAALLLVVLLTGMLQEAVAAEINGLYQASMQVTSRSNEQERVQAFKVAMRKVLIKLTGTMDTLNHPVIARALASPADYVEAWAYRSSQPAVGAATSDAPLAAAPVSITLEVSFFQSQIQNLLDTAAIPIWPSNRADTLLWVVEQDETGLRTMEGSAGGEIVNKLQALASDMGMPLIAPILDLQDQLAMRPETLWNFDLEAIRQASARYQTESILALRVVHLFGDQAIAKAVYLFRGEMQEVEIVESELEPFLASSISMAAAELSANYAILQSGINESSRVSLKVDGINTIENYAGLLRYVQSLAVVKSVQVLSVKEHVVELELSTGGQLRQLIESIALDRMLQPQAEPLRENQQMTLQYRWQSP